jgi:hypothetical protein
VALTVRVAPAVRVAPTVRVALTVTGSLGAEGARGVLRKARGAVRHPARAADPAIRYVCTVDKKNAMRAGALAAGTTLMMLLMTSPALAVSRDDGDDPGPGLSVVETLGLFVGIPLLLFAIITGLVLVLDKSHPSHRVIKPKQG